MKMRKFIFLVFMYLFSCLNFVHAEAAKITCSVEVNGQHVTISGQVPNAVKTNQVTLLVGSPENIIYIDQITSKTNGEFEFNFKLSEKVEPGEYNFKIGTDANVEPYQGVLNYNCITNKVVDADIDINISAYVPTISGTVNCELYKTVAIDVINLKNNSVMHHQAITGNDNSNNVSITLPSFLSISNYKLSINCYGEDETDSLATLSVNIDSSILKVAMTGNSAVAENAWVDTSINSNTLSIVDKKQTFKGEDVFDYTLPNVLIAGQVDVSAQVYETIFEEETEDIKLLCPISIGRDSNLVIPIRGHNITQFSEKTYEIIYDDQKIKPVKLYGFYPYNIVTTGKMGNIEILTHEDGKIVFKVSNTQIPTGKVFNGIVSIFKFKNITDAQVITELQFNTK